MLLKEIVIEIGGNEKKTYKLLTWSISMPKKYNYFITERKFTIKHSQNTSFFCISVDGMTLTLTLEEGPLKKDFLPYQFYKMY